MISKATTFSHRGVLQSPQKGDPGAPGLSPVGITTVTVEMIAAGTSPKAVYNAQTGALKLSIPQTVTASTPAAEMFDPDRIVTLNDEVMVLDGNVLTL